MIAGAGGALLIISLFLEWASDEFAGGVSGWELWPAFDVFFLIVGLVAIAAALLGGATRLFRQDLTWGSAADLLGVLSTVLLLILLIIDWFDGTDRGIGVYLALLASLAIAAGSGDYSMFRGNSRPTTTTTPPPGNPPAA
jgi:hypothetical protein